LQISTIWSEIGLILVQTAQPEHNDIKVSLFAHILVSKSPFDPQTLAMSFCFFSSTAQQPNASNVVFQQRLPRLGDNK